jgi:hypothetical protein
MSWEELRGKLRDASTELAGISTGAKLNRFDQFWLLSKGQFRARADEAYGPLTPLQVEFARRAYQTAKGAVDARWHLIREAEAILEELVRKAYRVSDRVHDAIIERIPEPQITWALRP